MTTDAVVKTNLADRLLPARKWARMDGQVLAKEVGVARKTVTAWEEGRSVPSSTHIVKIAAVLDRIVRAADAVGVPGAVMVPQVG